jgi:hypothetical protein
MGLPYQNENGEWFKECSKCKVTFTDLESNFYKHPTVKGGFGSWCKSCCKNSNIVNKDEICAWGPCGKTFVSKKCRRDGGRTKFCSQRCSALSVNHRNVWHRNCRLCSKPFEANRPGLVYCSNGCSAQSQRISARKRATPKSKIKKNMRKYDLTPEDYDRMFEEQGGLCAICAKTETATRNGKLKRLGVDHDHHTGRVRGLLCQSCNTGIGLFKDNLIIILHAARYIEQNITHPGQLLHTHDAIFGDKAEYWRKVFPNFSE